MRFDRVVPGGINLGGSCPEGCGFFCNAAQLAAEHAPDKGPDAELLVVNELFDFVMTAAKTGPLILFFKVSRRAWHCEAVLSVPYGWSTLCVSCQGWLCTSGWMTIWSGNAHILCQFSIGDVVIYGNRMQRSS